MSAGSSRAPTPPPPPPPRGFVYKPLAKQEEKSIVHKIPSDAKELVINMPSVEEQPKFLKKFKEKQVLLFMGWGSTLVSLAYLHVHSEVKVYKYVMNGASIVMAASFIMWLFLSYEYNKANEPPDSRPIVRLLKRSCYASAIVALAATFQTLYFPGDGAIWISLGIICVAAACVVYLQMRG